MRTRCPRCATVFRITPEQLRARGGKVRCGHCQGVFNALETLVEEAPPVAEPRLPEAPAPETAQPAPFAPAEPSPAFAPEPFPAPEPEPYRETEPAPEPEPEAAAQPEFEPEPEHWISAESVAEPEQEQEAEIEFAPRQKEEPSASEPESMVSAPREAEVEREETPEESTQAAREAGLVAARELMETPGYNRWAAGTLAAGPGGLGSEARQRPAWPFTAAALLLALTLVGQMAYHFRTEVTQRLPFTRLAFEALDIDLPLPRQADLVSIEASDLQSDNARSLLVLQATLKNRAAYDQAWPALELTLTDTQDTVVARRVLEAADYLPPKANPELFAANSETSIRLWIEAKEIAAAGYRLYVFYP